MIKYLKKENFFDILLLSDVLMLIFFILYIVFMPNLIAALFIYVIAKFLMLFFINKNVKNKFFSQWLKLFLKYTAFCLNIKLVISILLHVIYSTLL